MYIYMSLSVKRHVYTTFGHTYLTWQVHLAHGIRIQHWNLSTWHHLLHAPVTSHAHQTWHAFLTHDTHIRDAHRWRHVLQAHLTWHTHGTHISHTSVCYVSHTICTHTLQLTATHCNTLQHTATHCNTTTLQHTATHCYVSPTICTHTHLTWQAHLTNDMHLLHAHIWHHILHAQLTMYTHMSHGRHISRTTCTPRMSHSYVWHDPSRGNDPWKGIHMRDMTHECVTCLGFMTWHRQ
jgi:hypothetical protein